MTIYVRLGAAILAACSLGACATITRGTQQKFEIKSDPDGADVKLSTGMTCTTPCKMKLRRKDAFTATLSKPGYEAMEIKVESKVHGGGGAAMAGNILAGGLIGGIMDGTNGSMRDLTPNPIDVKLAPMAAIQAVSDAPATEAASAETVPVEDVPSAQTPAPEGEAGPAPAGAPQLR